MDANPTRAEAERLFDIAKKLLQAKDFPGSRYFSVLAQETDPLLDGPDQILAVVDVLIASQKRINNQLNYYAVLQINYNNHHHKNLELIKKHYRRLAFLLHPDKNPFAFAEEAFRLVIEAWEVLSDPVKKLSFDSKLNFYSKVNLVPSRIQSNTSNQACQDQSPPQNQQSHDQQQQRNKLPVRRSSPWAATPAPERGSSSGAGASGSAENASGNNFWTVCPYCYYLYEYPKAFVDCCLRCQNCKRAFHAAAIASLPPIVPGKEAYHCCLGFFPMGFTVANGVEGVAGGDGKKAAAAAPKWVPAPTAVPPPFPPPPPAPVMPEVFVDVPAVNANPAAGAKKRGRPKKA
ncbi:hypothetical protein Vadar_033566 [Vaccinium darrowii]|uniref:Uncharacterized protein n=1 Tax=Vaccinium darrowii TaxID=229202 RepID=A0ACB7Y459_9ERIC|nr:hypothetical protein Vadar_033566 [Vaccinium darrowii]